MLHTLAVSADALSVRRQNLNCEGALPFLAGDASLHRRYSVSTLPRRRARGVCRVIASSESLRSSPRSPGLMCSRPDTMSIAASTYEGSPQKIPHLYVRKMQVLRSWSQRPRRHGITLATLRDQQSPYSGHLPVP